MGFYSVKPTPFTLEDLADIKVDESKEQTTGCGGFPGNTSGDLWNAGFRYPLNGEFDWDSNLGSECWTCTNNWGEECFNAGAGGRGGRRGKIKRKSYKGDILGCCLNNIKNPGAHKIEGDYTCDPKYRSPTNAECRTKITSFCGDGDKIVTDERCIALANSDATTFNTLMGEYCNSSDTNAKGDKCINWCSSNSTSCTRLNTIQGCEKYGITTGCSSAKITNVKTQCQKYGMLSEQGMSIGDYACTTSGIESLQADCELYDLIDGEDCTATGISNAKVAKQSQKQADAARKQSETQFQFTKTALADVLNLPQNTTSNTTLDTTLDTTDTVDDEETPSPQDSTKPKLPDSTTIIIAVVVLILFLLLCSSSLSLVVAKK